MKKIAILFLCLHLVAGYAQAVPADPFPGGEAEFHDPFEEVGAAEAEVEDPLEPLNRGAFWMNDKLYTYVLAPACAALTEETREKIAAALAYLASPVRIANAEFDLRFRDAGSEFGRFVFYGILNFLHRSPPTSGTALTEGGEKFSQTLETMGCGPGFYLILPVLGPSTLRDGMERLAAAYLDPPFCLLSSDQTKSEGGDSLADELGTYETIRETALDPYLFVRNAYHQQQAAQKKEEDPGRIPARFAYHGHGKERPGVRTISLLNVY